MEAIDERRPHERLGDFLDRILEEHDIRLHYSRGAAKNYLAVSPVLMKLFEELKEKASTMKKLKQIQQEFKSRGGGSPANEPEAATTTDSYRVPRPYQKDRNLKVKDGRTRTVSDLIESVTGKKASKVKKSVDENGEVRYHHDIELLQEMDAIFDMFEPGNTAEQLFYKVVSCGPDYGRCCAKRFAAAPDDLLVRLFLQCLLEAPRGGDVDDKPGLESLKRYLGLVQDIVCEFGSLDLASMIDEDIDRYVRDAESAINRDMHLFHARAAIFLKLQDQKQGEKLGLEEFLDSVLAEENVKLHLPAETAKKYLTISPVMHSWFMILKSQSEILTDVSSANRKSSEKVGIPADQPSVTLRKKPLRRVHKRPERSEL